jgi:hypothetical protein
VRRLLQNCLLLIYRLVFARGLLRFAWGQRIFFALYDIYKARLEAGEIEGLRRWCRQTVSSSMLAPTLAFLACALPIG